MTAGLEAKRPAGASAAGTMLEARSVALVGASPRPGSLGQRMTQEVTRSPARPDVYLVNPRYRRIGERHCYPSLAELPGPVDLVLLGVPDAALEQQLGLAARRGDAAAVIFGNAHSEPAEDGPSLRERLAGIAASAGMALCGAGCMGFVNVCRGLRAIGYTEPDPLPAGPVALVTHSGSVFSALLRARRAIGFTLAVSSGQELVTAAPAYLDYALSLPQTAVLALVLEAIRQPAELRRVLAAAAQRDLPVVLLTVGTSASGQAMVAAHSGALAAADGGWEALARAHGVHRVGDLAELADTLELFAAGRRARLPGPGRAAPAAAQPGDPGVPDVLQPGIATVHDSGLERAHAADLADQLGVPFAAIGEATRSRLAGLLDPGLTAANPLDVWGTGAGIRQLFAGALAALADDPAVAAVALAVDLVPELDGDDSYPHAVRDAAAGTGKPVAVLSNLGSAIDAPLAAALRRDGIPVLEGLRTGLLALRHLLDHAARPPGSPAQPPAQPGSGHPDPGSAAAGPGGPGPAGPVSSPAGSSRGGPEEGSRRDRAAALLAAGAGSGAALLALLREYGIATARTESAAGAESVAAAAAEIGYPVVLKTDEPAIAHKTDAGGVLLGLRDPDELAAAYRGLAARLGPRVLVSQLVPPGTELALGIVRDPGLGPLIVVGAGGVLVELLADRAVALPPVDAALARQLLDELRVSRLLAGARGAAPADLGAVVRAITGLSDLACELGEQLAELDVNPLICGPAGAIAVDALAIRRSLSAQILVSRRPPSGDLH
jgi:acetate---CoA ligase (ADP-forming)